MASTDARPLPIKNTAFRVVFCLLDADGDLVTGASGLDSEVSKDQGTFADCTNEATEIATSSGMYYLDLTSTEMNADCVCVIVKTSTVGAKTTPLVFYPQELGDIKIDVQSLLGTAWLTPGTAGTPDVNVKLWNALAAVALPLVPTTAGRTLDVSAGGEAGVDWANVGSPTTALALTGTTIANTQKVDIETIKTQAVTAAAGVTVPASIASPTNITAGTITTVTNLTNAPTAGDLTATMKTSVTTAATAATPVAASVTGAVGSVASGGITAASFAADAITAAKLAADVTTELQAGLATAANLATVAGYIDTEVAAIKAKTDNLPASPAAVGDAMTLTSGERTSIADAMLDEANGVETSLTVRQALRIALAALAGKLSGAATTTVTIRNVGDSKARITATVDTDGNRSAVTTDGT